jgi:hypothetical protein
VLCVNNNEPVRSYLSRWLQRHLCEYEVRHDLNDNQLRNIFEWLPKVWRHVNNYIEHFNSADLTIGPKVFTTDLPMDTDLSCQWFIHLWNTKLVPFMVDTVREGVQVYGLTKVIFNF